MVERDSSLQRTCFHCSNGGKLYTTPADRVCAGIAHGDIRLVFSCSAMGTQFMKLSTNSSCADVACRCFSTRSVSLCGLSLRGWAVVAPRCFHFTITAPTVDWGSSSRAESWQTDLLERWDLMTVPRWKSEFFSHSTVNVCLWRLHGCVLAFFFFFIHLTGVTEIAEYTNLKGCPHTRSVGD